MNPPIGFILLTHEKPAQIIRLVHTLDRMFDRPPIVCHHDFGRCALPLENFRDNISFVRPHLHTAWGDFSLVKATVRALEQLYTSARNPDWFVLLSGSDYPIKSAAQILQDLNSGSYDAHIRFDPIRNDPSKSNWERMCYFRYCTKRFPFPPFARGLRPGRPMLFFKHPILTGLFLPYSRSLRCFAGSSWFCANRESAKYILEFYETNPALARHYQNRQFPDESYFQTILANAPELRLNNNNWRYTDFSSGGSRPKTLTSEDFSKLIASAAHFARKFDGEGDQTIFDGLDALIFVEEAFARPAF